MAMVVTSKYIQSLQVVTASSIINLVVFRGARHHKCPILLTCILRILMLRDFDEILWCGKVPCGPLL